MLLLHTMKIVAVGRNFRKHALELNHPIPKIPFFFLKPESSVISNGETVVAPIGHQLHYEVELAIHVQSRLSKLNRNQAKEVLSKCNYGVAIDFTLRDVQKNAIESKLPWTLAKGLDTFCPLSEAIPGIDPDNVGLWLNVNGIEKQNGDTSDQIFDCAELLSYITNFMTLEPSDVVLTGTPSGVGPVKDGDVVTCGLVYKDKTINLKHHIKFKKFDFHLVE
eukprot:NODE_515_length_7357_cov_0.487875.p4 type:complete len:221 gc:universal NODE_515_length_7357_cov_0.487875:1160-1822(+)